MFFFPADGQVDICPTPSCKRIPLCIAPGTAAKSALSPGPIRISRNDVIIETDDNDDAHDNVRERDTDNNDEVDDNDEDSDGTVKITEYDVE